MEGREPRAVIISRSPRCNGVQEAFIALLVHLLGVLGVVSCSVGVAVTDYLMWVINRGREFHSAYNLMTMNCKHHGQASGEDSYSCIITWSLKA